MLTFASHWAATKLGYTREEMSWNIPLSFIFLLIFEQQYQDREGKMINLQDRELIDNGEMDKQFKRMREMRVADFTK